MSASRLILTINGGSSSLKVALYRMGDGETLALSGGADRLGSPGARLRMADPEGRLLLDHKVGPLDQTAAFKELVEWLDQHYPPGSIDAVGHRLVHGGRYSEPQLITDELIRSLRGLAAIDPNHTPQSINVIELAAAHYPKVPQAACFDTAFHRHLPRFAEMYALPRHLYYEGILRYGFHGLSYEYICQELARLNPKSERGQAPNLTLNCGDSQRFLDRTPTSESRSGVSQTSRVIAAHLGNGASMAAIRDGVSIDTSMGFTPASGLVMGTRSGDVDPGAIVHLIEEKKMTAQQVNTMINQGSGLLGISGSSEDMQDLLNRESSDPRAAEAIQLFCYSAKKHIGGYAAALGGLDTVVFTGGIGENAPSIRERTCQGLDFLGIMIDDARNNLNAPVISTDGGRVEVRVIKTNEDLMIARHTARLIGIP